LYKYHFPLQNKNSRKYLIFLEKFVGWSLLCGDQPTCLLNRPTKEEKKTGRKNGQRQRAARPKKGKVFCTSVILEDCLWSDFYKILLCCFWQWGLHIDRCWLLVFFFSVAFAHIYFVRSFFIDIVEIHSYSDEFIFNPKMHVFLMSW